jgi:8-oxo-dGTP diphosphatase
MAETTRAILCYIPRFDKHTLMIHRNDPEDFLFPTHNPPGGKIEYGERPIDCAHREVLQETGLQIGGVKYRGTVLFDHSQRPSEEKRTNQSVDIFCASEFSGTPCPEDKNNPLVWMPNHEIPEASGWNGGELIYKWLQDGWCFDAIIKHLENGQKIDDIKYTSYNRILGNPYRTDIQYL